MASELQAGKYLADGQSASAPSYSFGHTTATGMYSPGANQIRFSTASTDRLTINTVGRTDVLANTNGDWAFKANNAGNTGWGALIVAGGSTATQIAFEVRKATSDVAMQINGSGLARFTGGIKSEKGILSGTVLIADDAVTTITPPRKGGFMKLLVDSATAEAGEYPQAAFSGEVFFDCGTSLQINKSTGISAISGQLEVTTSDVSGSSGNDNKVTIAVQSGVIKIENRSNGTKRFNYFLYC